MALILVTVALVFGYAWIWHDRSAADPRHKGR